MKGLASTVLVLAFVTAGCTGSTGVTAAAELRKTTESGVEDAVVGWANFTEEGNQLTIRVVVVGLSAGEHGIHVHEMGDCGATTNATTGAKTRGGAAGPHFNPANTQHGQHAGDLGNVNVQANGRGAFTVVRNDLTVEAGEPMSILGRSVVVHANPDDLTPTANFGARTLCGTIQSA